MRNFGSSLGLAVLGTILKWMPSGKAPALDADEEPAPLSEPA